MKYLVIAGLFMNMQSMQITIVNAPLKVDVGLYRDYRTGTVYEVIGTTPYSENQLPLVVYIPVYDSLMQPLPANIISARPLAMFFELIDDESGNKVPRFKKINV